MLTPKQMRSANKINIDFRSSSPLFWRRIEASRKARRRQNKRKLKERRKKKERKKHRKRSKRKRKMRKMKKKKRRKMKKKHKKRAKKKRKMRKERKKGRKRKRKKKRKKGTRGLVDIRMKGKALKSIKKKVSAKRLLKKAIAKQLKRKMRKMSHRAKKALAKTKKSKKARKHMFQSKMAKAIRSTVRQAEQVCMSLTRTARQRFGSFLGKVRCRFNDAERLIRRFEKSRSTRNNRKLTKAVSGIMAAVASHMRPLVDVLYQQTLTRYRTVVILKRLRDNVATVLRRLVRQAFSLRRALADAITSYRKLSVRSKSTPPYSSSKKARQLYASISKFEAGKSKEAIVDTVARVISVVSQVFHNSVEDLLRVYRLRQITEVKRPCDKASTPVDCINAHVFPVLEHMVDRSSSLVRNLNRILPKDATTGKRRTGVPKAIHVDARLLKRTGGRSACDDDVKQASATRVARVIVAVARNLRLVVDRLKLAVIRKKLSKSAAFSALLKSRSKAQELPKPKPSAKPLSAKPPPAKPTVRHGGTMTLKSLNRVMLSPLISLEKWSRLLYWQTASDPEEAWPKPVDIHQLPSTSARQSAKQASIILAAITRRLRIVGQRVGKMVRKKLPAKQRSAKPLMTLKSLNRIMLSTLLSLEKWSRLLYQQTASDPEEAWPEPLDIDHLPSTSVHQSAKQASIIIAAIARRLRTVGQRVGKTVQKKLAAKQMPVKPPSTTMPRARPTTAAVHVPSADIRHGPKTAGTTEAKTVQHASGTITLKSINRVLASTLLSLEKWSRLLYQQTASSPEQEIPEVVVIDELSSTSAHQSAKQVALILSAIARRLRTVRQRVGKTVRKKLAARKTPTEIKPVVASVEKKKIKPTQKPSKNTADTEKSKPTKLKKEKVSTTNKSLSPKSAQISKKVKPQQKGAASETQTAKSKQEKAASKSPLKIKQRGKQKSKKNKKKPQQKGTTQKSKPKKGKIETASKSTPSAIQASVQKSKKVKKKPKKEKKEKVVNTNMSPTSAKQKTKKGKKPKQKEITAKTKPAVSDKKTAATTSGSISPTKLKSKDKKKPKQKATGTKTLSKAAAPKTVTQAASSVDEESTEPETPRHVINRDDMSAELLAQSHALTETMRGIATKIDDAIKVGDESSDQFGIQAETKSEAENLWIRFMNERLKSAKTRTQKKKAIHQPYFIDFCCFAGRPYTFCLFSTRANLLSKHWGQGSGVLPPKTYTQNNAF